MGFDSWIGKYTKKTSPRIDPCMGKVEVEKTSFFLGAAPRDDFHGGKLAISFREFAPFSPTWRAQNIG